MLCSQTRWTSEHSVPLVSTCQLWLIITRWTQKFLDSSFRNHQLSGFTLWASVPILTLYLTTSDCDNQISLYPQSGSLKKITKNHIFLLDEHLLTLVHRVSYGVLHPFHNAKLFLHSSCTRLFPSSLCIVRIACLRKQILFPEHLTLLFWYVCDQWSLSVWSTDRPATLLPT